MPSIIAPTRMHIIPTQVTKKLPQGTIHIPANPNTRNTIPE